jgi:peptidoglycan/xylan/chitin deacetylase (PgdA/CDA1 family)
MKNKILILSMLCLCLSASYASAIEHKRIALSVDDAPSGLGPMFDGDQRSQALLDNLTKVSSGPVVFFVNTEHLDQRKNVARIRDYAAAGHLIANHSHQRTQLSQVDVDQFINNIDQAEHLLSKFANRRPWFRFPLLDEGSTIAARNKLRTALSERGLQNGYVTIDNYDWYLERKWMQAVQNSLDVDMDQLRNAYLKVLMEAVRNRDSVATRLLDRSPAHVLLLHENDLAALFIDDLVTELRNEGWEIISPDEAYQDPIANTPTNTLLASQGKLVAMAVDAGEDIRTLSHTGIQKNDIDRVLDDYRVFSIPDDVVIPNPH